MEPISRVPIVQQVEERIRELIQEEQYQPGKKLPPEMELCQRLGVGRGTVREAFRLLQAKGVVEIKPEYKNLIAMPDPKSSGTGYFFYKNWVNTMGEDEALAYVDKLHDNLKQFTESGSGPIKMLTQGEVAVGLGMTFQAVSEINEGQPFEIIYPPTGSPYSLTGTALIDGHQDKTGVSEVFDYIINDFLVYDKENFSPELVLKDQKNNIPNYPQDIQYADMTGIEDVEEKERLLSLWKY